MTKRKEEDKKEILARMSAFNYSGFSTKVHGNVCYYYQSFVGRDFKGWMQMAIFIISSYLTEKCLATYVEGMKLHMNLLF